MIRLCPQCGNRMELVHVYKTVLGGVVEALYIYRCPRCGLTVTEKHIYELPSTKWISEPKPFAEAY